MAFIIEVNINDFDTADDSQYVIDHIKKTFDKEHRFKLIIGGFEDPDEKLNIRTKGSDDNSYEAVLHFISTIHLLAAPIKKSVKENN